MDLGLGPSGRRRGFCSTSLPDTCPPIIPQLTPSRLLLASRARFSIPARLLSPPNMSDTSTAAQPSDMPRTSTIAESVIRIAGDSQDGIQAIGGFLARLAGRS